MILPYLDETIASPDGIACRVLDSARVDFTNAAQGRKAALTLVCRAEGGENIETKNKEGLVESVYVAKAGDAIFVNLHNRADTWVPGNTDGTRWQFAGITEHGYEVSGRDSESGGILLKSTKTAALLHEAVQEPTCVKNAWGEGNHAFLYKGATLKLEGDRVTGIDKHAFDNTWEITTPAQPPATKARAAFKPK